MSTGYSFYRLLMFCMLFAVLTVHTSLAQNSGSLKGTVRDKSTNEELPGANIIVRGTSMGAATDLDGNFLIRNIPAGEQVLVISYIGYIPDTIRINIPSGRTLEQDFELSTTVVEGEEVVVTGQALGQLQAINQQLASDRISNVVSEQRIQELPDFNAAQALSRLPGVSTTQSSGEANKVVIRGLSPKYNSIEVEGVNLSATGSASIGISSNPDANTGGLSNDRSVDLTMISPYMIRTIAVYKSLTPDMSANSIGGTVNMELREAPEGLHWDLLWQSGYTAKSEAYGNYRGVVSGSNRFFDNTLGIYALLNAESYDRNADNLNATYDVPEDASQADPVTGLRPVEVNTIQFERHLENRERLGANLIMDYQLSSNASLKFVNLFARINSDYTDHRQTTNFDTGVMSWVLRLGENVTDQRMHSLKLDYDLGFMTADISANYTSSSNKLDRSPQLSFNQTDALTPGVQRNNMKPEDLAGLLSTYKGSDEVILRSGNIFSSDYKEEKLTYKADFEIPFSLSTGDISGFIKVGGQYNNQENETDQEAPYLGFNGNAGGDGNDIQTNLMREIRDRFGIGTNSAGSLIGTSFINTDDELFETFLDDKYGDIYYVSDPTILNNILDYIVGNPSFNASNRDFSSGAQGGWYDGPYQRLINDYNYKEDYYATYAMAKVNFMNFMIIGGARYEKVENEYYAWNARDQRNPQSQIMYDTTSYTDNEFLLPMGQIKYSPFDWMDIRYAYTQTLARPDYTQISPKFNISQGQPGTITAGNPQLKPAKAFNHDVNVSFYNNELGLLTVGGFYKTIENFVYSANYQLDAAQKIGIDHISRYTIVRDGANVVIPNANATVIRPVNNPFDAIVKGIELDFQHNFWYMPAPFNNLVIGINYARIYSEAEYPFYVVTPIPGSRPPQSTLIDSSYTGRLIDQPNHVLNSYLGYDYEGFSARFSFVYQDNSATQNGGRITENDGRTSDYFRVDFSARQQLPFFNTEVFLDLQNLNDENTSSFQKSIGGYLGIQNYGLTANLGVRIRY